ncbi:hypothetical protein BJV78DRAFT_1181186 [Lactifluus subvellereus]|nr:hypothetical protein BJV78DRAFT_1181186 [Lactifluus subvellereus]
MSSSSWAGWLSIARVGCWGRFDCLQVLFVGFPSSTSYSYPWPFHERWACLQTGKSGRCYCGRSLSVHFDFTTTTYLLRSR